jgi:hypothetical protein
MLRRFSKEGRVFPSFVITGLVPVISTRKAQRLTELGWPGQARL